MGCKVRSLQKRGRHQAGGEAYGSTSGVGVGTSLTLPSQEINGSSSKAGGGSPQSWASTSSLLCIALSQPQVSNSRFAD
ncbi:hypothetical protein DY000_02024328 [Brassica cretica]|uniref:Uncharacterized protein n=1 Tax=Brassica cretica TaxID=69181 RepID=A0ABQ7EE23_BRACR|nr:hypothetical protein DY000_02024328 [Brassica cretica]